VRRSQPIRFIQAIDEVVASGDHTSGLRDPFLVSDRPQEISLHRVLPF
jgi:hypothetical protein